MINQHPITPPRELLDKWNNLSLSTQEIFVIVAQWGADQELEACCEWLDYNCPSVGAHHLRAVRRPKPPSLKEQALGALGRFNTNAHMAASEMVADFDTIRRALEALPE
jgi:hypothetical protein